MLKIKFLLQQNSAEVWDTEPDISGTRPDAESLLSISNRLKKKKKTVQSCVFWGSGSGSLFYLLESSNPAGIYLLHYFFSNKNK